MNTRGALVVFSQALSEAGIDIETVEVLLPAPEWQRLSQARDAATNPNSRGIDPKRPGAIEVMGVRYVARVVT